MTATEHVVLQPFRRSGEPGESCTVGKTFTDSDVALTAGVSGNLHPLYMDRSFAIAHGLAERLTFELTAASLCVTAAAETAGADMRLLSTEFSFPVPITVGTTVRATATIESRGADSVVFRAVLVEAESGAEVAGGRLTFAATKVVSDV